MKYGIFAIYDVKTEAYMTPFFMGTDAAAVRSFGDALKNPDMPFGRHPADYTLFRIGQFNDHRGQVEGQNPESLGTALELLAATGNQNEE